MTNIERHQKATEECLKAVRRMPSQMLVFRALAILLRNAYPTIYDMPPDEAAVFLELGARGQAQ